MVNRKHSKTFVNNYLHNQTHSFLLSFYVTFYYLLLLCTVNAERCFKINSISLRLNKYSGIYEISNKRKKEQFLLCEMNDYCNAGI